MDRIEWTRVPIVDASGRAVGEADSPFPCILAKVFAWLAQTSSSAKKMQMLYRPVHSNYKEDFSRYTLPETERNLFELRYDFERLKSKISYIHTTEFANTCLAFVNIQDQQDQRPQIHFTTLLLQALQTAATRAEQHHLLLATFLSVFHELGHLLGRWVSVLCSEKGNAYTNICEQKFGSDFVCTPPSIRATIGSRRVEGGEGGEVIEEGLMGGSQLWHISGDGAVPDVNIGFRFHQLRSSKPSTSPGYYVLDDSEIMIRLNALLDDRDGYCQIPFFTASSAVRVNSETYFRMTAKAASEPALASRFYAVSAPDQAEPVLLHVRTMHQSPIPRQERAASSEDSILSAGRPLRLFFDQAGMEGEPSSDTPGSGREEMSDVLAFASLSLDDEQEIVEEEQDDQKGLVITRQGFCRLPGVY